MLKQVGNRISGVRSVTRRRRLYHENVVGSFYKSDDDLVGAPTTTKPQNKIDDDDTRKEVEDYFKAVTPCKHAVGVQRNLKIIRDDMTGKIVDVVGFEFASSYHGTYGDMLAGDAIKAAVEDYEAKKAKIQ